jgi:hypothetical protein
MPSETPRGVIVDMLIFRPGNGSDNYAIEYFGELGEEVRELFDTAILPTPYFGTTPPWAVLMAIQHLNPDREVCLHPDLLGEGTRP